MPPPGANFFGNPSLAAGPDGTFYYASLVGFPYCCEIAVVRSLDGGVTWKDFALVSGQPIDGVYHDKPWIAVDRSASPHRGSVYVGWTEWVCDDADARRVLLARSEDGGRTFSAPLELSIASTGFGEGFPGPGVQMAVGPSGEVYALWIWPAGDEGDIWFVRSLDGGKSFSKPTRIAKVVVTGHDSDACVPPSGQRVVLNGDIRVPFPIPSLAVDTSGSPDPTSPEYNPFHGRLYLAVGHDGDGKLDAPGPDPWPVSGWNESDIAFSYSSDRGATWSDTTPDRQMVTRIINDDDADATQPGKQSQTDQFHPQVAVDERGRVAVTWYDRRVSGSTPPNWEIAVFAAVSHDGGVTFEPNFQVSNVPFPPSRTNPNTNWLGGCYMGLYNGLTPLDGGGFLAAWGDNRNHIGQISDMDVYADTFSPGFATGPA